MKYKGWRNGLIAMMVAILGVGSAAGSYAGSYEAHAAVGSVFGPHTVTDVITSSMTTITTSDRVYEMNATSGTGSITFDGGDNVVVMNGASKTSSLSPIQITGGATLRIYLAEGTTNTFKSTYSETTHVNNSITTAAIYVSADSTVIIDGPGALDVQGGKGGAGIGGRHVYRDSSTGHREETSGTIIINDGHITAKGGINAAAIGGGSGGNGTGVQGDSVGWATVQAPSGPITINGGTIVASSRGGSAAIGAGYDSDARGPITITGGTITATVLQDVNCGAAIGSGDGGEIDSITITGGTITASSQSSSGIGTGRLSNGSGSGPITITGGTIIARSNDSTMTGVGGRDTSTIPIKISSGSVYTATTQTTSDLLRINGVETNTDNLGLQEVFLVTVSLVDSKDKPIANTSVSVFVDQPSHPDYTYTATTAATTYSAFTDTTGKAYLWLPKSQSAFTGTHPVTGAIATLDESITGPTDVILRIPDLQIVNVVYVDDDDAQVVVTPEEGTKTTYAGESGAAVGFTEVLAKAGMPHGYEYVSMINVPTFDDDTTVDQTITVHLRHGYSTLELITTRTIHYQGAGPSTPIDVTQSITWTATTDLVTNNVVYTTTSSEFPAVSTPAITGYMSDIASVPVLPVTSPTSEKPESIAVTVTYTASLQAIDIIYVDDDTNGATVTPVPGTPVRLTGPSGSAVDFTEEEAKVGIPQGYEFRSMTTVESFDFADAVNQVITIHLGQGHSTTTLLVMRTIHYQGAGAETPMDIVQPMTWTVTMNLVTGTVVYTTDSTGYPAVTSPAIDGYRADITQVNATTTTSPTNLKPGSSTVTVTYTPTIQVVNVVYVDDDAEGTQVQPIEGTVTRLTGLSGTPVVFTESIAKAGIPSGYVFVSLDSVGTYDFIDATDQTMTIHLREDHSVTTLDITRGVHYTGAGDSTPKDVVHTLRWTVTTNQVTGVATYTTDTTGYPRVDTPHLDGYQADRTQVEALHVTSPTHDRPFSIVETVTYTPTTQVVNVVYVDDDAYGQVVAPGEKTSAPNPPKAPSDNAAVRLSGPSGSPVGFTEEDARARMPQGYVLAYINNVDTYDFIDSEDQMIVVHVVHAHVTQDLVVTRKIHYMGAGSSTPPDVVQSISWRMTKDLVTNKVVYATESTGYSAVDSPVLNRYDVSLAQVPATVVTSPTEVAPRSTTVTIAYSAVPILVPTGGEVIPESQVANSSSLMKKSSNINLVSRRV